MRGQVPFSQDLCFIPYAWAYMLDSVPSEAGHPEVFISLQLQNCWSAGSYLRLVDSEQVRIASLSASLTPDVSHFHLLSRCLLMLKFGFCVSTSK